MILLDKGKLDINLKGEIHFLLRITHLSKVIQMLENPLSIYFYHGKNYKVHFNKN